MVMSGGNWNISLWNWRRDEENQRSLMMKFWTLLEDAKEEEINKEKDETNKYRKKIRCTSRRCNQKTGPDRIRWRTLIQRQVATGETRRYR